MDDGIRDDRSAKLAAENQGSGSAGMEASCGMPDHSTALEAPGRSVPMHTSMSAGPALPSPIIQTPAESFTFSGSVLYLGTGRISKRQQDGSTTECKGWLAGRIHGGLEASGAAEATKHKLGDGCLRHLLHPWEFFSHFFHGAVIEFLKGKCGL